MVISYKITKTRLFKYIENFTTKKGKFSDKKSDIFHMSSQNIDCGYPLEPPRRGGSNEYPQSMFLRRNKKNNVYPCKPQFYYIKVELKGVKIICRNSRTTGTNPHQSVPSVTSQHVASSQTGTSVEMYRLI